MSDQKLTQIQRQELKLSPQQIQLMKLLQLPLIELEQRIKEEIEANPALEDNMGEESNEPANDEGENYDDSGFDDEDNGGDNGENDDYNDND